ncbi:MAG TPA: DUF4097 family beta strand repeat-containing protein [Longimicrobiaceae bacterium]
MRSARSAAFALALALLPAAAGPGEAQEVVSWRADASRDGTVTVRAGNGRVRVVGWGRDEVVALSRDTRDPDERKGRGPVRITSGRGETRVRISGHEPVEVRVPSGSRVDVATATGDVEVTGVTGAVDLESTTGDFRITGNPRMVSAEGLSGRFELKGSTASLRVKTMSGDILVPRAVGFVELVTVTGDIDVTSRGVRRGTLRSTAGRTRFAGSVPRDGSLRFETSSGEIDLRLPRDVAADFELTSLGGGEILSELGPEPRRSGNGSEVEVLRFSSGSGGAEITARTVSGSIRLRRQ